MIVSPASSYIVFIAASPLDLEKLFYFWIFDIFNRYCT
jgi:hypothetical protein